jgi:NAD(P)H-hydrate epimerase
VRNKIIFIDAILGTGVKGSLDEKFTNAINFINDLKAKNKRLFVVSLDVPSGLTSGEPAGPVINADMTISMGTHKSELLFGNGKENSGEVIVVPIGITDDLIRKYESYKKTLVELADVKKLFPRRRRTSYKYSNGKALIIGGSKGLSGAVAMSSLSALKCGAGGVVAAIPETISSIFNKRLFEIMTLELEATPEGSIASHQFDGLRKRLDWADAVLIGPGISLNQQTGEFVYEVIAGCNKNLIIDADALTLLSGNMNLLKNRKTDNQIILSPHLGEFSRLTGISINEIQSNRFKILREFVVEYKVNIALKSETTVVCLSNGDIYVNTSGNESLATIGSGDVLSGIMVSLLAQTKDVHKALVCGNYLHGLCADIYAEKYGNKQTATPQDMIRLISSAVSFVIK